METLHKNPDSRSVEISSSSALPMQDLDSKYSVIKPSSSKGFGSKVQEFLLKIGVLEISSEKNKQEVDSSFSASKSVTLEEKLKINEEDKEFFDKEHALFEEQQNHDRLMKLERERSFK